MRNKFPWALLLLSFVPQFAHAGQKVIRVLSFNIKGLPYIIDRQYDEDRFRDIGKILAERRRAGTAPDIVFLQESFIPRTGELRKEAAYPYAVQGPSRFTPADGFPKGTPFPGGLFILSEFPLGKPERISYGVRYCGDWDCMANKGSVRVEVEIPGIPGKLTLMDTHTQADTDTKSYDKGRTEQMKILADFLHKDPNPENPLIFGGDFNSHPPFTSFAVWKDLSQLKNVGEQCLDPANGCQVLPGTDSATILAESLDHIFYHDGSQVQVHPLTVARPFNEPVNGRMLSDHLGYESDLLLTW